MTFQYGAGGTRAQTVASLDALTDAQMGSDTLGKDIRDILVEAISVGTDLEPPSDQRYRVDVSGHSGRGGIVTLQATVQVVSTGDTAAAEAQAAPEEAIAADLADMPPVS